MLKYLFETLDQGEVKLNPMETAATQEAEARLCKLVRALVPDLSTEMDWELIDCVGRLGIEFKRVGFYAGFRTATALAKEFTDIPEITTKNAKILEIEREKCKVSPKEG